MFDLKTGTVSKKTLSVLSLSSQSVLSLFNNGRCGAISWTVQAQMFVRPGLQGPVASQLGSF